MPKKTDVLNLQDRHSRNTNDWSVRFDDSGRYSFEADGMGVLHRILILTDYLEGNPQRSENMGKHLHSIHASYRTADVSQPIKQMLKLGMVTSSGKGRGTIYSLVPNAKAILRAATKVWS